MNADTKKHLADRGFVREDATIDRPRLVEQFRPIVPTIDSLDEVEAKATLVTELRELVLGSSGDEELDRELNYLAGDVLSVAPDGKMQKSLENGFVLCSVRVRRNGDKMSRSARFISSDPDVVQEYASEPAIDRAVKAATRANSVVELTGRRIPALASRRPVLARKAQEQLALAMPLDVS